jgi:hypothetical protein
MPMGAIVYGQVIGYEYFNLITFINFNKWAGLLLIDKINLSRKVI